MNQMIPDMEEILAEMREKFIETAQEKTDRLSELLGEFSANGGFSSDQMAEFMREIHSLKGMGGTFQMPLMSKLCHAFENFLEEDVAYSRELIDACHQYVDRIIDLMESEDGADETKTGKWLDGLPTRPCIEGQADTDKRTVLVVSSNVSEVEAFKKHFSDSAYHVLSCETGIDAFGFALGGGVDVFVGAQVLPDMDGAELIRSLMATRKLSKARFAMICPSRRDALSEELKNVHLLSAKRIEHDAENFIAIVLTA